MDLDDPTYIEFEYLRRLAHAVDCAADEGAPLDVLHLGGGALTLPRYVAATRPGSRQDVVDADQALVQLVRERLPVPADAGIALHAADAREWVARAPAASADLLVADVFGGSRVPAHLTSVAYARLAQRVLKPGGVYAANLADGAPFTFLRSQLATFQAVFAEVVLIAEPSVLRGRRFGTRSCWPRPARWTWRRWPGARRATPSRPGSSTATPCAASSVPPGRSRTPTPSPHPSRRTAPSVSAEHGAARAGPLSGHRLRRPVRPKGFPVAAVGQEPEPEVGTRRMVLRIFWMVSSGTASDTPVPAMRLHAARSPLAVLKPKSTD